jgi:Bacterial Ig-like domain (group 3)/Chitobiase/beta-hexosaminidase C-terminal domain
MLLGVCVSPLQPSSKSTLTCGVIAAVVMAVCSAAAQTTQPPRASPGAGRTKQGGTISQSRLPLRPSAHPAAEGQSTPTPPAYKFFQLESNQVISSVGPTDELFGAATDGTSVVYSLVCGGIFAVPFTGGTAVNVAYDGMSLPDGQGSALTVGWTDTCDQTSVGGFGHATVIDGNAYVGAYSTNGDILFTVPVNGGNLSTIVYYQEPALGTLIQPSGQVFEVFSGTGGTTIFPGSTSYSGGVILSTNGNSEFSKIFDSSPLNGDPPCGTLGGMSSDGTLTSQWVNQFDQAAGSYSPDYVLVGGTGATFTCTDTIVDLGNGSNPTILPGQPAGTTYGEPNLRGSSLTDSGYVYFEPGVYLNNGDTLYDGIFRVKPGGQIEKIVGNLDFFPGLPVPQGNGSLGGSVEGPIVGQSFAVKGNLAVFGVTEWIDQDTSNTQYDGIYSVDISTGKITPIVVQGDDLGSGILFEGGGPDEGSLTDDGKFAFWAGTGGPNVPQDGVNEGVFSVNLNAVSSETKLTVSPTTVAPNDPVTLTATVESSSNGDTNPLTESVTFYDGTTSIGTANVDTAGTATFEITTLSTGIHSITAIYSGDINFKPSGSAPETVSVVNADTLALTSSVNPQTVGSKVTFTAAVIPESGTATPTGSVVFSVDGGSGTSVALDDTGHAAYATSALAVGEHAIAASYSGDTNYSASSTSLTETILGPLAATPVFSPVAGTYATAQNVTLTDSTPGAVIYYTTNGTTPTASSTKYTGAITVSATETIEAIAIASGYTNSAVASATYTIKPSTTSELKFIAVTPCRIVDTRNATGAFGGPELAAAATRSFDVPQSGCGIPTTAVAYSLNVTVVPIASLGYLTIWPAGQAQPNVSTLNSTDGRVKANATITPAGTNGGVSVYASDATQFILDIDGYFVPAGTSASGLEFYPLTPCRIADTRNPTGALGGPSLAANTGRAFPVQSSACGIPSTAKAYSLNITAVPHASLGYLTAWPSGEAQPVVSTLNATTGAVTANAAIVPAGTGGDVSIVVSDAADVILDVNGYFAPPASGGLSLYTVTPCRVTDTRNGAGAFDGTLAVPVHGSSCAPPATAQAYVLNATVVPVSSLSYLTLWAAGGAQPEVSTLNATDGAVTSNMAIVPTTNGTIDAFATDPTNLLLDLSSYFAP